MYRANLENCCGSLTRQLAAGPAPRDGEKARPSRTGAEGSPLSCGGMSEHNVLVAAFLHPIVPFAFTPDIAQSHDIEDKNQWTFVRLHYRFFEGVCCVETVVGMEHNDPSVMHTGQKLLEHMLTEQQKSQTYVALSVLTSHKDGFLKRTRIVPSFGQQPAIVKLDPVAVQVFDCDEDDYKDAVLLAISHTDRLRVGGEYQIKRANDDSFPWHQFAVACDAERVTYCFVKPGLDNHFITRIEADAVREADHSIGVPVAGPIH